MSLLTIFCTYTNASAALFGNSFSASLYSFNAAFIWGPTNFFPFISNSVKVFFTASSKDLMSFSNCSLLMMLKNFLYSLGFNFALINLLRLSTLTSPSFIASVMVSPNRLKFSLVTNKVLSSVSNLVCMFFIPCAALSAIALVSYMFWVC